MKEEKTGWLIINIGHPRTGEKSITSGSFRVTKRACINDFIEGTNGKWNYWKTKYNFRCVRATQTTQTSWH